MAAIKGTDGTILSREKSNVEVYSMRVPPSSGQQSNNVVVVTDASKELKMDALDWAFKHAVQPGDTLTLLGVLLHSKSKSSTSRAKLGLFHMDTTAKAGYDLLQNESFNTVEEEKKAMLEEVIAKKVDSLFQNVPLRIHERCETDRIKLKVHVAMGATMKEVTVQQAEALHAHLVVLDRNMHLKKDNVFYANNLSCNIVRLTTAFNLRRYACSFPSSKIMSLYIRRDIPTNVQSPQTSCTL